MWLFQDNFESSKTTTYLEFIERWQDEVDQRCSVTDCYGISWPIIEISRGWKVVMAASTLCIWTVGHWRWYFKFPIVDALMKSWVSSGNWVYSLRTFQRYDCHMMWYVLSLGLTQLTMRWARKRCWRLKTTWERIFICQSCKSVTYIYIQCILYIGLHSFPGLQWGNLLSRAQAADPKFVCSNFETRAYGLRLSSQNAYNLYIGNRCDSIAFV